MILAFGMSIIVAVCVGLVARAGFINLRGDPAAPIYRAMAIVFGCMAIALGLLVVCGPAPAVDPAGFGHVGRGLISLLFANLAIGTGAGTILAVLLTKA